MYGQDLCVSPTFDPSCLAGVVHCKGFKLLVTFQVVILPVVMAPEVGLVHWHVCYK